MAMGRKNRLWPRRVFGSSRRVGRD
jgi:hypothetical protein